MGNRAGSRKRRPGNRSLSPHGASQSDAAVGETNPNSDEAMDGTDKHGCARIRTHKYGGREPHSREFASFGRFSCISIFAKRTQMKNRRNLLDYRQLQQNRGLRGATKRTQMIHLFHHDAPALQGERNVPLSRNRSRFNGCGSPGTARPTPWTRTPLFFTKRTQIKNRHNHLDCRKLRRNSGFRDTTKRTQMLMIPIEHGLETAGAAISPKFRRDMGRFVTIFVRSSSQRPYRLVRSRTPGFHPGNTGSNPVGVAICSGQGFMPVFIVSAAKRETARK
jgi:hypothetical protein